MVERVKESSGIRFLILIGLIGSDLGDQYRLRTSMDRRVAVASCFYRGAWKRLLRLAPVYASLDIGRRLYNSLVESTAYDLLGVARSLKSYLTCAKR